MEQSIKYFVLVLVLVAFTVAVVTQTSMSTLVSDYNVMAIAVHRCFETAADAQPHTSGCWESLRPVRCLTPLPADLGPCLATPLRLTHLCEGTRKKACFAIPIVVVDRTSTTVSCCHSLLS